ncbi:carbonic anhydrase [Bacillus sp. EB600]|uniref:carbonic anhydrase n=2 Tax=Bacillus sp. EB600 TaxID=2806345 RepID=UPI00210B9887|nr:carbonic anhydrase family protein [Bacillus sp. EB600]MCQ6282707.1 carbonic anhydrase family protein [Bacillus sp. EB600]
MKKLVYPFLAVSLNLALVACSEQTMKTTVPQAERATETEKNKKEENDMQTAYWSYEGETGPEYWGELDRSYASCVRGSEQSPINIEYSQVETNEKIENVNIQYKPTPFSLIHNGHTVQANTISQSNKIIIEGEDYKLTQFHFHTPSEHQFNGQQNDMELHLVHQNKNGQIAVLGVMIQEGKENEKLTSVWDVLPEEKTEKDISIKEPIDLQAILPPDQTSFSYNGSLTTPPCTEEVKWIVFEKPIEMSKEQVQAFQQIFPDNHRPVQPLDEREIIKN